MGNIMLLYDNQADAGSVTGPAALLPLSNLQSDRIERVWRSQSDDPVDTRFDVALPDIFDLRAVVIGPTNLTTAHRYRIRAHRSSARVGRVKLDFKQNRREINDDVLPLAGGYSFARVSSKWAPDLSGAYAQFGPGALARTNAGALIEEARTNLIKQNDLVGTIVGLVPSPGRLPNGMQFGNTLGLSVEVVGTGIENGLPFLDVRFSGQTTSSGQISMYWPVDAVVGGGTFTLSAFARILSQTGTMPSTLPRLRLAGNTAGGWNNDETNLPLTPSAAPMSVTRTMKPDSIRLSAGLHIANNGVVQVNCQFVIRIGLFWLEAAALASSPIVTTGAAATRQADVLTLPASGSNDWTITFDDGSTQQFLGINGNLVLTSENLNRQLVVAAEYSTISYDSGWVQSSARAAFGSLPWGSPFLWSGFQPPDDPDRGSFIVHVLPAPVAQIFWTVEIDDRGNPDGFIEASRLLMCRSVQPSINYQLGQNGLSFEDNALRARTLAGGEQIWRRVNPRVFQFGFDYLPEPEAFQSGSGANDFYDLMRHAGFDREVFVIPDPNADGLELQRRSFLGTFSQMNPLSQVAYGYAAAGFTIKERI
ncbi:MAG: hypothetical protein K0R85_251 [Devosia sp.]|jgi:hypothetical protein|nr:hypothetical protein [Devosia sp.]